MICNISALSIMVNIVENILCDFRSWFEGTLLTVNVETFGFMWIVS